MTLPNKKNKIVHMITSFQSFVKRNFSNSFDLCKMHINAWINNVQNKTGFMTARYVCNHKSCRSYESFTATSINPDTYGPTAYGSA